MFHNLNAGDPNRWTCEPDLSRQGGPVPNLTYRSMFWDVRIAKVLRFGRTRTNIGIDIYNLTNSNVPLGYTNTFGTTWMNPTSILDARFAKVSAQIDF